MTYEPLMALLGIMWAFYGLLTGGFLGITLIETKFKWIDWSSYYRPVVIPITLSLILVVVDYTISVNSEVDQDSLNNIPHYIHSHTPERNTLIYDIMEDNFVSEREYYQLQQFMTAEKIQKEKKYIAKELLNHIGN